MAKKNAAPKSKPASDKPKTKRSKAAEEETVYLYIPATLYQRYVDLGKLGKHKALRDLFHMVSDGDDDRYDIKHCMVQPIEGLKESAKEPAAKDDDDDGRDPIKLCDDGGW